MISNLKRRAQRLDRKYFERPTLEVARDLIGKLLIDNRLSPSRTVRIVEVEAYIGEDDPACHAARGPTKRNRIMYGPAGFAYVYLIYGMYHCLNVVTEDEGYPAAVLIRAVEPVFGTLESNPESEEVYRTDGPGKLCRALKIDLTCNGLDLTKKGLYLADSGDRPGKLECSPRIGISLGTDKMWRFFDATSSHVSQRRKQITNSQ